MALTGLYRWLREHYAESLVLLTLLLFFSKSLYSIPYSFMAALGAYRVVRSYRYISASADCRAYAALFACLWIPLLISWPDAVNLSRSTQTVLGYLRFGCAGIYILYEINTPEKLHRITLGIVVVVAIFAVDGLHDYLLRSDYAEGSYLQAQLAGGYHKRPLGHVIAVLSPIYFECIRRIVKCNAVRILGILPIIMVVFLGGRRVAWLMLLLSGAGYFVYLYLTTQARRGLILYAVVTILLLGFCTGIVTLKSPAMQARVTTTLGLFDGSSQSAFDATAGRTTLWQLSAHTFFDHWVNGVGPRGFRYIYKQYLVPDDYYYQRTATHPHQFMLEILAETGIIGMGGYILFIFGYLGYLFKNALLLNVYPWWAAVVLAIFPLNAHQALYGSYWSTVIWTLAAVSLAAARLTGPRSDNAIDKHVAG